MEFGLDAQGLEVSVVARCDVIGSTDSGSRHEISSSHRTVRVRDCPLELNTGTLGTIGAPFLDPRPTCAGG